ncbi:uncharacterized protein LOC131322467 [Rhododendron vialii]|uniref:uncharacterized protein LOC131322467 n=1 Tax=Rhododendron vialii TaxID=182163 RepID=UPI00265DF96B|nr:uncharacterized protein LOC131322467 [Rhododendron vialii]
MPSTFQPGLSLSANSYGREYHHHHRRFLFSFICDSGSLKGVALDSSSYGQFEVAKARFKHKRCAHGFWFQHMICLNSKLHPQEVQILTSSVLLLCFGNLETMGAFTVVAIMMQLSGASGLVIAVLEKKAGPAPRKGYINDGKPIDTLKSAVETKIESTKEVKKVNKESFSSPPVMHFPPLSSSGTRTSSMATNDVEVVEVEGPTKQKRRSWRKSEEDALMKCMLNEAAEKWKAENGFKTGYFTHLEKELEKVLPGCNLKANPHIDSNVRYWKSVWARIVDITNLSGYGWDAVNKCIDVEQAIWDVYEKAHPKKAQGLYEKSFPYFEDWQTIFGKDRATGTAAEDYDEITQPDIPNESVEPHNSNDFYDALLDNYDQHLPNTPTTPVTPTPHSSLPTSTPRGSTPAANAGVPNKRKRTRMGDAE